MNSNFGPVTRRGFFVRGWGRDESGVKFSHRHAWHSSLAPAYLLGGLLRPSKSVTAICRATEGKSRAMEARVWCGRHSLGKLRSGH